MTAETGSIFCDVSDKNYNDSLYHSHRRSDFSHVAQLSRLTVDRKLHTVCTRVITRACEIPT